MNLSHYKKIITRSILYVLLLALILYLAVRWYQIDVADFGAMAEGWNAFLFKTGICSDTLATLFLLTWFLLIHEPKKDWPSLSAFVLLNVCIFSIFFSLAYTFFYSTFSFYHLVLWFFSFCLALFNVLTFQSLALRIVKKKSLVFLLNLLLIVIGFMLFVSKNHMVNYFPHVQFLQAAYLPNGDFMNFVLPRHYFFIINGLSVLLWSLLCHRLEKHAFLRSHKKIS